MVEFKTILQRVLRANPFFRFINQHLTVIHNESFPAVAGVTISDGKYVMYHNDEKIRESGFSEDVLEGIIQHEFMHIAYNHVENYRFFKQHKISNLVQDAVINEDLREILLSDKGKAIRKKELAEKGRQKLVDFSAIDVTQGDAGIFFETIDARFKTLFSINKGHSSDFYYERLKTAIAQEEEKGDEDKDGGEDNSKEDGKGKNKNDDNEGGPTSSHDHWEQADELNSFEKAKIKSSIRRAMEQKTTKGSISQAMQAEIQNGWFKERVRWERVLSHFVNLIKTQGRSTINTWRRRNKKGAWLKGAAKRKSDVTLLLAVDQSGSVSDDFLSKINPEIARLSKSVGFILAYFDTNVDEENIIEWKRGEKKRPQRMMTGGTNFLSVVEWAEENAKKRNIQGIVFITDMKDDCPRLSKIKRIWLTDSKLVSDEFEKERVILVE